jgi:hypothetical protein
MGNGGGGQWYEFLPLPLRSLCSASTGQWASQPPLQARAQGKGLFRWECPSSSTSFQTAVLSTTFSLSYQK